MFLFKFQDFNLCSMLTILVINRKRTYSQSYYLIITKSWTPFVFMLELQKMTLSCHLYLLRGKNYHLNLWPFPQSFVVVCDCYVRSTWWWCFSISHHHEANEQNVYTHKQLSRNMLLVHVLMLLTTFMFALVLSMNM